MWYSSLLLPIHCIDMLLKYLLKLNLLLRGLWLIAITMFYLFICRSLKLSGHRKEPSCSQRAWSVIGHFSPGVDQSNFDLYVLKPVMTNGGCQALSKREKSRIRSHTTSQQIRRWVCLSMTLLSIVTIFRISNIPDIIYISYVTTSVHIQACFLLLYSRVHPTLEPYMSIGLSLHWSICL